MEVASGDYGDMIGKLSETVQNGDWKGSMIIKGPSETKLNQIVEIDDRSGKQIINFLSSIIDLTINISKLIEWDVFSLQIWLQFQTKLVFKVWIGW